MNLIVDHYAVRTADMDKAIDFYSRKLGLKLLSKTVDKQHNEIFAFLQLENGMLELLQVFNETSSQKADLPVIKPPYTPHLAFKTDDIENTVLLLMQKNIDILKGPLEIKNEVKWFYIADTDNNIIEFVQWLNE